MNIIEYNIEVTIIGIKKIIPFYLPLNNFKKYFRFAKAITIDAYDGSITTPRADKLPETIYFEPGTDVFLKGKTDKLDKVTTAALAELKYKSIDRYMYTGKQIVFRSNNRKWQTLISCVLQYN